MILYSYEKCSSCKKAQRFLEKMGIKHTLKDISTNPPSLAELRQMLHYQKGNLKKIFNTSGNLYKEMQLSEKLQNFSLEQSLKLLSLRGMLVKRPFLLAQNFGLTGFNEEEWLNALE